MITLPTGISYGIAFMVEFGKKNQGIPKSSGTPLTVATIKGLKHLFLIQGSPFYSQATLQKDCSKSKPYLDEKANLVIKGSHL